MALPACCNLENLVDTLHDFCVKNKARVLEPDQMQMKTYFDARKQIEALVSPEILKIFRLNFVQF